MFDLYADLEFIVVGTSCSAGGPGTSGQDWGWYEEALNVNRDAYAGPPTAITTTAASAIAAVALRPPRPKHRPTLAEIGGAKAADLDAAWGTLVTPYEPCNAYVIEGFVNDSHHNTPNAAFRASVRSILQKTGSKPVFCLPALMSYIPDGEKPSLFAAGAENLRLVEKNAIFAEEIVSVKGELGTYADIVAALRAKITLYNTGDISPFRYSTDGLHFSAAGRQQIKQLIRPYVTFSPVAA